MSALPRQVQQQADEVARIEAEMKAASAPEAPEQPPAEPETPEASSAPPEQAQPAPEAPKPTPATQAGDDETWQKRYLTLQGMFNAEVPRLNEQIKALQTQISTIQTPPEPKKSEEAPKRLVTEQDEQAFGSDLLDVVKRQAQEIVAQERVAYQQMLDELRAENTKLQKQLGSVSDRQVVNDRTSYVKALENGIPSFAQWNNDDGFKAWLDEADPRTGLANRAYLNDAYHALDVERTVAVFKSWPESAKYMQPKPTPPSQNAALARQVAPNASRGSGTPAANQNDKVWKASEVDKFYKDYSTGMYRGKEAEAQRIEAEIDLAVSQGRYTP